MKYIFNFCWNYRMQIYSLGNLERQREILNVFEKGDDQFSNPVQIYVYRGCKCVKSQS